jgi:Family of unknown function (DUF5995)
VATNPPPPAPIPTVTTIKEVIEALQSIIDWSISVSSRLGYFAALYKRITIAVGTAIEQGAFENGPRMERFDVAFAVRYFDALNGHFHPRQFPKPTRSWQVTFDGAHRPQPIIVQHMFVGVVAHILLDLGIVAREISPQLPIFRNDFNTINAVLASQVNGVVEDINELSPALADVYAVLQQNQIFVINEAVRNLRDSAWRFGALLAAEPAFARAPTIWVRDRQVAKQEELIYDPPSLTGLIASMLRTVGERESRDIVKNLRALDEIASTPAPIKTAL